MFAPDLSPTGIPGLADLRAAAAALSGGAQVTLEERVI